MSSAPLPDEAAVLAERILADYWLPARITISNFDVSFVVYDGDMVPQFELRYEYGSSIVYASGGPAPHWYTRYLVPAR